jgi:two-component system sensor histidine kinase RegB
MERNRRFAFLRVGAPDVRVRTLVALRWLGIVGQLATLAVVGLLLGFPLPWGPALAAIGASAILNAGLVTLYPRTARLAGREALLHLAFDLVQLGVLVFLTGGLANPFSLLLLVPVTVAATLLSARATMSVVLLAVLILIAQWQWALPLPWAGVDLKLPETYRLGILIAETLGLGFLAAYTWRISAEGRRHAQALAATQGALEREAKMSALGSLAAAAAHELGGPLGTITLVARELEAAIGDDPEFGDDIRLLNQEAKRSRDILVDLAKRAEGEEPFPRLALAALLREVAQPYEKSRTMRVEASERAAPLMLRRSPELLHGLANLVSNAARHAASEVVLRADVIGSELVVTITDDGPGFDAALLPQLGEPFLGPSRSGSGGTGLGIFIATTLLERTGGQIAFSNARDGGAKVEIRWRRTHIERNDDRGS